MASLIFDDPFPGITITVLSDADFLIGFIKTEYRILNCYLNDLIDGPAIEATSNIQKFQIDMTAFVHCQSNTLGGAVRLDMSDNSLAIISRSCASDCQCGINSEGHFARILISSSNRGRCVAKMVSIDQCQKEDMSGSHTLLMRCGIQTLSNINVTNGKNFKVGGFSNCYNLHGSAEYCNLVGNYLRETLLLYASYHNIYKYLNIVSNVCSSTSESHLGLIRNYGSSSYLLLESIYAVGNTCKWFIENDGVMALSGCYTDSLTITGNAISNVNIVNNGEFKMTLLASCGFNADIPYLYHFPVKSTNNNNYLNAIVFLIHEINEYPL